MQAGVGVAGDDERVDVFAVGHQPPQRQRHALVVLQGLDAVGAFLQGQAFDLRLLAPEAMLASSIISRQSQRDLGAL